MAKKKWTEAERKAFGEKMKQAREKKQKTTPPVASKESESQEDTIHSNQDVLELRKQVEELQKTLFFAQSMMNQPAAPITATRSITKYSVDPSDYPDPRERLSNEARLVSEAFKENFVMNWEVGKVNYDAKDGVHYTEPKFRLELWRRMRDPETNEFIDKNFLVKKVTMFEDPDAAIQAAIDAGEEVPEQLAKPFLDEMRYLRIRDWIYDIFWPKPPKPADSIREEVIGNKLVRVMETSSVQAQEIPFGKL